MIYYKAFIEANEPSDQILTHVSGMQFMFIDLHNTLVLSFSYLLQEHILCLNKQQRSSELKTDLLSSSEKLLKRFEPPIS